MRRLAIWYIKLVGLASILLLSFSCTYVAINHERLFPRQDQAVIYGRDSCVATSALREYLDAKAVPYIYASIDRPLMKLELEARLNLPEERRVALPVVLVGGRTLESPDQERVLNLLQRARNQGHRPVGKTKAVTLTDAGLRESEQLLEILFGKSDG